MSFLQACTVDADPSAATALSETVVDGVVEPDTSNCGVGFIEVAMVIVDGLDASGLVL